MTRDGGAGDAMASAADTRLVLQVSRGSYRSYFGPLSPLLLLALWAAALAPSTGFAIDRAQLALGRLRSAEPRLGEARRDRSLGRRPPDAAPDPSAGALRRKGAQAVERHRRIFLRLRRGFHERRDFVV